MSKQPTQGMVLAWLHRRHACRVATTRAAMFSLVWIALRLARSLPMTTGTLPAWSIWKRGPRHRVACHRIAKQGPSCFAVGTVGALCMAMSTTEQNGRKSADALDLDPTDAALVAMDEARAALDADLAATISAATDLVADCRLALAICTAWNPRGVDTI